MPKKKSEASPCHFAEGIFTQIFHSGPSPESPGYQGFGPFLFGTTKPTNPVMTAKMWPEFAERPCQRRCFSGDFLLPIGHDLFMLIRCGRWKIIPMIAVILLFDDIGTMADHGVSFNNGSSCRSLQVVLPMFRH